MFAILISSCGGTAVSDKNEVESNFTKKQKPTLTFKIELIKKGEDIGDRYGDLSETKIIFKIDGEEIDNDLEIGIGEALNREDSATHSQAVAFVSGDISEKGYFAKLLNDTTVAVLKTIIENGEQTEAWTRVYEHKTTSGWSLKVCNGNCEGINNLNCEKSRLFVSWDDPDKSGTNIRNIPNGKVVAIIRPSEFEDGCYFEIVETSSGWFKIKGNIIGPDNEKKLPNGEGWIHGSVISVGTRNYGGEKINLLDRPENGKIVGIINGESNGLRIKDLCGQWIKVEYKGMIGWISSSWLCGNPWTTCG